MVKPDQQLIDRLELHKTHVTKEITINVSQKQVIGYNGGYR